LRDLPGEGKLRITAAAALWKRKFEEKFQPDIPSSALISLGPRKFVEVTKHPSGLSRVTPLDAFE
jgi:hypothetical protein